MIRPELAKNYISNVIWERLYFGDKVAGNIDYFPVMQSAIDIVRSYCPCWQCSHDLLPYWACIFEWILYSKSSDMGSQSSDIPARYSSAIEYLVSIKDTYCLGNSSINSSLLSKGIGSVVGIITSNWR